MKYGELNDASLVMLTLSGEASAYEVLVSKYENAVISAARSVTRSTSFAEDAAQDAFVTAWMKLDVLKDPSKYRSWVCRIAGNCARRMMERYRSYVDFEVLSDVLCNTDESEDPVYAYEKKEEAAELHDSIARLPERVQTIVRLYYSEGRTIGEIAEKLGVTVGTVKSGLFDGRKKLRKDLCAMDEERNDTLTERVMKKVEELKKWQYKKEKTGFEAVYRDVLSEVELLPESESRQSAMADVLMRGYWWAPGEKNDALLARIREAALAGKNEDVMTFVVRCESEKLWGDGKIAWLRDNAIPDLLKNGFKTAAGSIWVSVMQEIVWSDKSHADKKKEAKAAAEEALRLLPPVSEERCYAAHIGDLFDCVESYGNLPISRYRIHLHSEELRQEQGETMYWGGTGAPIGDLEACDLSAADLFYNASILDGHFTLSEKEQKENSHGKLCRTGTDMTVETPAGIFEHCVVWTYTEDFRQIVTYYKDGIGIVRQDYVRDGYTTVYLLSSCSVTGDGLLPFTVGNSWCYGLKKDGSSLQSEIHYAVEFSDDQKILLICQANTSRSAYNDNCWEDMVQAIANEYYSCENGQETECDVSHYVERAKALAATPAQKAHTEAAASVAERIMHNSTALYPDTDTETRWNFFERNYLCRKENRFVISDYNSRWSFEWKQWDRSMQCNILLNNFVYNILSDIAQCLWNDAWEDGYSENLQKTYYSGELITNALTCTGCGTVTVPAGSFENCLKITMQVSGYPVGLTYRNGKHDYIFAPGVGLISATTEISGDIPAESVYLLTAYEGVGEGYMPIGDGFFRRYDAQNLTDGYIGWTEYRTVKPDNGDDEEYLLFSNQCGDKKSYRDITLYSSVRGEQEEAKYNDENRHAEGQALGKLNDLKLLCHFLFRRRDLTGDGSYAAAHMMIQIETLKAFGGGKVPDAFLGWYAIKMLTCASAFMGCGQFEKGFACLDESLAAYRKYEEFPADALLPVGVEAVYQGVSMVKGKPILVLPDGTREVIPETDGNTITGGGKGMPYQSMTHLDYWAWFKPATDHPVYGARFEEYREAAKKLAEE